MLHPVLRLDKEVVGFLEDAGELPRATSTSALSSASVLRLIGRVGDTVNKMTYKMEEGDSWYEEKTTQIEQMENQLRHGRGGFLFVILCSPYSQCQNINNLSKVFN